MPDPSAPAQSWAICTYETGCERPLLPRIGIARYSFAGARIGRGPGVMPVIAAGCWPDGWRGPVWLVETVAVGSPKQGGARWPAHLPVGALRVVRWSGRYD